MVLKTLSDFDQYRLEYLKQNKMFHRCNDLCKSTLLIPHWGNWPNYRSILQCIRENKSKKKKKLTLLLTTQQNCDGST